LLYRRGNMATAAVGIYPVIDGHIGIHAMPKNWPQLMDALDMHWMDEDDRFCDNRARLRNDDELLAQFYIWTAGVTKADAYERAGQFRAPISPVNTMADLLASPHLNARNFFHGVDHPHAGSMRYAGAPAHFSKGEPTLRPAPTLGEHNSAVYGDLLGLTNGDLRLLAANGSI
jgi:crotonobetainyl-CoA:carnitine CoA-transferase CaiB-like acyl-CoA transferase